MGQTFFLEADATRAVQGSAVDLPSGSTINGSPITSSASGFTEVSNTDVDTGGEVLDTFTASGTTAVCWFVSAAKPSAPAMRTRIVVAHIVKYTLASWGITAFAGTHEVIGSLTDIGIGADAPTDPTFAVTVNTSTGVVALTVSTPTENWIAKAQRMPLIEFGD